jgi:hypothetical protein
MPFRKQNSAIEKALRSGGARSSFGCGWIAVDSFRWRFKTLIATSSP